MKYAKTSNGRLKVSFTSADLKKLGADQTLSGHFHIDRGGLLTFPKKLDFFNYSRATDAALYELEKIAEREAPRQFQFVPRKNPRPRIGTKKATRASSATGKRPTKRLVRRRKTNTRKGYFPNPSGVRIVHNKLLGGWFVVRGPHQTPLNGRFDSKAEAQEWLQGRQSNPRSNVVNIPGFYSQGKLLQIGAKVKTFRGETATVENFEPPHKPASEGFITTDLGRHYAGVYGFKWVGPKAPPRNPVRRLAIRQGIRFYRKHGGKWLMFASDAFKAKTKAQAMKIAAQLAQMYKAQIKVVID